MAATLAVTSVASVAEGQGPVSLVGVRVIERPGPKIANGRVFIGSSDRRFIVYRVEVDEGNRLQVRGQGMYRSVLRWLPSDEVLILEYAEAYLTAQAAADPSEPAWLNERGLLRLETKAYDGALSDFGAHIRLRPNDASGFVNRAIALKFKNELDKALLDLDEAIRLEPGLALAHLHRGDVHLSRKDYDSSVLDEDEAIRRDSGSFEAHRTRGWARYYLGDSDKAVADFTEAIRLDPEDAGGFFSRANVLYARGEYARSLSDANEAVRLDPKDHQSLNIRAVIWASSPDETLRDGPRAVESAMRACDLSGWRDAYYLRTLAAAHAEIGQFDSAVQWQERAHALQQDERERQRDLERVDLYKARKPYRSDMR
jgi:tetratricopeptide (TPR) repeat protein